MSSLGNETDFWTPGERISRVDNGLPLALSDQPVGFRGSVGPKEGEEIPLRLRELGFVPGTEVMIVRRGPFGDPIELELRGYRICLRREDLETLQVIRPPV